MLTLYVMVVWHVKLLMKTLVAVFGSDLNFDGADLRARGRPVNSVDIYQAIPGASDWVASREVDFETAAVGAGRDGEDSRGVALICSACVLGDDVVDWEPGRFGICCAAGARKDIVVDGWDSRGE